MEATVVLASSTIQSFVPGSALSGTEASAKPRSTLENLDLIACGARSTLLPVERDRSPRQELQ